MAQTKPKSVRGHYDLRTALPPAGDQYGKPPPSPNIRTALGAVVDPLSRDRRLAIFNRRVDVLEDELAHRRISPQAFEQGRRLQAAFEARDKVSPAPMGDGGSTRTADQRASSMHDRLARMMDDSTAYIGAVQRVLYPIDVKIVLRVLRDRMPFSVVAQQIIKGPASEKNTTYVAKRFRHALETLAEAWSTTTGPTNGRIVSDRSEERGAKSVARNDGGTD